MYYYQRLILSVLVFTATGIHAQHVGINTSTPDASAALEIKNTNKGLLIPRVHLLSTTDYVTIPSPAPTLLVYNSNASVPHGAGYYFNNGNTAAPSWKKLISTADVSVAFAATSIQTEVPPDSSVVLPMNTKVFDVSNNFITSGSFINPSTFIAPVKGIYHFDAAVKWFVSGNSLFTIYTQLRVNGLYKINIRERPLSDNVSNINTNIDLNSGDKVTLACLHSGSQIVTIGISYLSGNLLFKL